MVLFETLLLPFVFLQIELHELNFFWKNKYMQNLFVNHENIFWEKCA